MSHRLQEPAHGSNHLPRLPSLLDHVLFHLILLHTYSLDVCVHGCRPSPALHCCATAVEAAHCSRLPSPRPPAPRAPSPLGAEDIQAAACWCCQRMTCGAGPTAARRQRQQQHGAEKLPNSTPSLALKFHAQKSRSMSGQPPYCQPACTKPYCKPYIHGTPWSPGSCRAPKQTIHRVEVRAGRGRQAWEAANARTKCTGKH